MEYLGLTLSSSGVNFFSTRSDGALPTPRLAVLFVKEVSGKVFLFFG